MVVPAEVEDDDDLCAPEADKDEKDNQGLPTEILMTIFSYLDPRDLCRVSQVCLAWNTVAMDHQFWRELWPVKWAAGEITFHQIS